MIRDFVTALKQKLNSELERRKETLSVGLLAERVRDQMVGQCDTYRETLRLIDELYKAKEDDVDISDTGEVTTREVRKEDVRTLRRRRNRGQPRSWGAEVE